MTARHRLTVPLLMLLYVVSACATATPIRVVRGINDVSIAVIQANKLPPPNTLSDVATAHVLTINKQLLDIIEADPKGFRSQALTVIVNARQALPAPINAVISGYLATLEGLIQAVQP